MNPARIVFTLEPGMSERELEKAMADAAQAQKALYDFLDAKVTEDDLCAILEYCSVDVDELAGIVNHNLDLMGIPSRA